MTIKMGVNYWHPVIIFLWMCVCSSVAIDNEALLARLEETEWLVKVLSNRLDLLESRKKVYLKRIADLESRDRVQQHTIDQLTKQLREQVPIDESGEDIPIVGENTTEYDGMDKMMHTVKGRSVQRIRQSEVESPVAFYALLDADLTHAGINQLFIFKNVRTNVGNAYNNVLGMFTAPVEGIYVFSTTMVSYYHVNGHTSIYKNDEALTIMFVSGAEAGVDSTGTTVVLHLVKGDIVTVRNGDSDVSYIGNKHSSFSGFLLYNYTNSPAIVGK